MDADAWQIIKQLFDRALALPACQRPEYIESQCADDRIRSEIYALLAAHGEAEEFLEPAASGAHLPDLSDALADAVIGQRIGAYQIQEVIGEGGMGAVYLATRADEEFEARVAVKVIRSGLDTATAVHRFHTERQVLADLNHPHIAHLLDGGTTPAGQPYLVMEYIDGVPIDDYCDREQLSTTARLRLFLQVCTAVSAAHQRLVVHRDLKPGNILVTGEGQVKLLDFGIAKLLSPDGVTTEETMASQRALTPRYASPEQLTGDTVTTATDVYALGVLLYVLLTGRHPHRLEGLTPNQIEHVVCNEEPAKPSTAVSKTTSVARRDGSVTQITPERIAKQRGSRPRAIRRELAGDLDSIVLMAMRKEPELRYASVVQLAQDIENFIVGRPVVARPRTWTYMTRKYVRRHRVGVAATALVLLTLALGLAATAWEAHVARQHRRIAEQRFDDVRTLANAFLFEFHDAIRDLPGSTTARHLIVERALQYLSRLAAQAADDRSLQQELVTAYVRVGDIQGNPYFPNLGDAAGALKSYTHALELCRQLTASDPANGQAQRNLAAIHRRLADMRAATGDIGTAFEQYTIADQLYDGLIAAKPHDERLLRQRAANATMHAALLAYNGQPRQALDILQQTCSTLKSLAAGKPVTERVWRDLEICHQNLGQVLASTGDQEPAKPHFERSLQIARDIAAARPHSTQARRDLAFSQFRLGGLLGVSGKTDRSIELLRSALTMVRALATADPANAQAQRDVSVLLISLGDAVWETGDYQQSRDRYREAQQIRDDLLRHATDKAQALRDVALCFERLGDAEDALDHHAESLGAHQQGLALRRQLLQLDPSDWNVKTSITYSLTSMAQQHMALAQQPNVSAADQRASYRAARTLLNEAAQLWRDIYAYRNTPVDQRTELSDLRELITQCLSP